MTIELITNGALPKPGKCISCGYSGPDRWYFRFQAFIPGTRGAQMLLCTAKYPGDDVTGCMNEAARRFELAFVDRKAMESVMEANTTLRDENDRLGTATNKFTDGFASLVSSFLSELSTPVSAVKSLGKIGDNSVTDSTSGQAEHFIS